jgi:hypothetical protein
MAFWCDSKQKREAKSLAEILIRFPAGSRRHPNTDGVLIFLPGGKTASRSPARRFPVSTSPEPFHIENQHLPIGSHRGLKPNNQNAIHTSLLRPLALRASRATQCSNPLKSQSKRLLGVSSEAQVQRSVRSMVRQLVSTVARDGRRVFLLETKVVADS